MKEKLKNRKKEIIIISIMVMILICFFSGFSMGKGFDKKNINGKGEIAKPILEIENGSSLELTNTNNKGIYEFKVKNYNKQGEKTEVDLEYYIEILEKIENTGLELKLLKNDQEIQINDNKTERFILPKDELKEDKYRLEITYDKDKNVNMEDIFEQLQIKVHSEQKQEVL